MPRPFPFLDQVGIGSLGYAYPVLIVQALYLPPGEESLRAVPAGGQSSALFKTGWSGGELLSLSWWPARQAG